MAESLKKQHEVHEYNNTHLFTNWVGRMGKYNIQAVMAFRPSAASSQEFCAPRNSPGLPVSQQVFYKLDVAGKGQRMSWLLLNSMCLMNC